MEKYPSEVLNFSALSVATAEEEKEEESEREEEKVEEEREEEGEVEERSVKTINKTKEIMWRIVSSEQDTVQLGLKCEHN